MAAERPLPVFDLSPAPTAAWGASPPGPRRYPTAPAPSRRVRALALGAAVGVYGTQLALLLWWLL